MPTASRRLLLALPALAVVACGSSATSAGSTANRPQDPRAAVAASVANAGSSSYTATFSFDETLTLPAGLPGAPSGPVPIHTSADVRAETQQRVAMTMHVTSPLSAAAAQVIHSVIYDGAAYMSTDGGASWKTLQLPAQALTQYGGGQVLQYLQAAGTVTDTGTNTVDGQRVETYHATLDAIKATEAMANVLSSTLGSSFGSQLASAITLQSGAVDVAINDKGQLIHEQFNEAVDIDYSKLAGAAGAAGAEAKGLAGKGAVTVSGTCDFANWGTPQTVTRPTNVTGTLNNPLGGA